MNPAQLKGKFATIQLITGLDSPRESFRNKPTYFTLTTNNYVNLNFIDIGKCYAAFTF